MSEKELSLKTKIGYGVCNMGGNMFFTVVAFWLKVAELEAGDAL